MASESNSNSLKNSPRVLNLAKKMVDTIRPILAAELETEVRVQNEEMGRRLISLQDQFEALQSKHRALLLEMERSRKEFERKKAEWQTLKELISKKNNLKGLLSTTDITHRYISGVTTVDVAIETDQLLVGNLEPSLSSKDKLDDLIGLVDSDSIISDSNSEPFPPSRKVNKEASPATKLAPVAPEKLGSTSMLKHGQAKDCTCCSKFYQIVGRTCATREAQHIAQVSRHRLIDDIPDTPPGFWDVNFTPRQ